LSYEIFIYSYIYYVYVSFHFGWNSQSHDFDEKWQFLQCFLVIFQLSRIWSIRLSRLSEILHSPIPHTQWVGLNFSGVT